MVKVDFLTNLRGSVADIVVRSDSAVELCINSEPSPVQSSSLESSMSSYDSMMQSLHEELNSALPNLGDVEDVDFFSMDCATAISFDYEMNYTLKHLKHIAAYYGLKCKTRKADLIQDIVLFEMDDKNGDAVVRRKRMFHYMDTLKTDEYFKSYVIM
jgi:hypothetical protein